MNTKNIIITHEELIERSQEVISDLEFDISSVVVPYSEFIKPLKKNSKSRSIEIDSYIKNILRQELL
jgi:hypothetical protein